jgi:hypothetical protein
MAKPFIRFEKKNNGSAYASIYTPKWENGKKVNDRVNLGVVIDKDKGIFKNRKLGVFHYDLVNGFQGIPSIQDSDDYNKEIIFTFGDIYALNILLQRNNLINLFK